MPRGVSRVDGASLQGRLWTPAQFGGALRVWLDAADVSTVTLVSGNVSEWRDKSGQGNTVSQSTSSRRPTFLSSMLNGLPGIRFNGAKSTSGTYLSKGQSALGRTINRTVVSAVVSLRTAQINSYHVSYSGRYNAFRTSLLTDESGVFYSAGRRLETDAFEFKSSGISATTDVFYIQTSLFDYSTAKLLQFVNGDLSTASTSFQTAGDTRDFDSTAFSVGTATSDGSADTHGAAVDIGEVIITQGIHDTAKIDGYLGWKWAIPLAAGHPFASRPPLIGD